MMNHPDVSIIIVNYRSAELVKNCLQSVYDNTVGVSFEVIVVNNSPEDETEGLLAKSFPLCRYIASSNDGFGAANNVGAKSAHGKYLFFLNPDTLLLSNAVLAFYDFMEKNPTCGCCGGALLNLDRSPQVSFGRFQTMSSLIFEFMFRKIFPGIYRKKFAMDGYVESQTEAFEVNYVTGADLFMSSALFSKVGRFDSDFFLYFEETDLCHRLKQAGYHNFILPGVQIVHLCGQTTSGVASKRQIEWFEESRYRFIKKHNGKSYSALFRSIDLLFIRLALAFKPSEYWNLRLAAIKKLT